MNREKFVTMLDGNTPPGWTPPVKAQTNLKDEVWRLKASKHRECRCGSADLSCKCMRDLYVLSGHPTSEILAAAQAEIDKEQAYFKAQQQARGMGVAI